MLSPPDPEVLSSPAPPPRSRRPRWRRRFLEVLRNTANVRASCQAAGISRQQVYVHRRQDPEFARAWQEALEEACDVLEAVAWERARTVSDTLLIFLLKAHRPHLYRDTFHAHVSGLGGGPVQMQVAVRPDLSRLTDDEVRLLEQLTRKIYPDAAEG